MIACMARTWEINPRVGDPRVVVQQGEDDCGLACAAMLLIDRGMENAIEVIHAMGARGPLEPRPLANLMNGLEHPSRWRGGSVDADGPALDLLQQLCGQGWSWAAQIHETNSPNGHWVVVDGVDINARLLQIRDPRGRSYGMDVKRFLPLWRRLVLVMQVEAP